MWKMIHGGPHPHSHWDKKMWSPGPPPPRDPIKLPFLDVTPTSVLQRLRDRSTPDSEDERGLALWTTDTIDLSRTAPSDLGGYRGVYLGKIRQGSSYTHGGTVEKGYSLLPNKYGGNGGAGSLGSARAGERSGSRSPSMPRRINALAPLEQGDSVVTVSRVGSTRSVIPPLSAARRQHQHRDTHSDLDDDVEVEEEEDDKSELYYEEDEEEDEEVEEEEEEEVLVPEEEEDERSLVSRPKSSATTRDSGISIFSSHDGETVTENGRDEALGATGGGRARERPRTMQTKGSTSSLSSSLASTDDPGRSSYDVGMGRGRRGGELVSPSAHSLPNEALQNTGFGVVGKGLAGGGHNTRSRTTPGSERDFHNFDYESDFETDEEDPHNITLSNTTLTKMKLLRKKKENLKDIERRRQERETRRAQEERARKYKQLEMQHSQNSLQPSRADSGEGRLAVHPNMSYRSRSTKVSPHPSPRRRPKPSPAPSPPPASHHARIPKSRSHNSNLSRNVGRTTLEKRHRSLERGTTNMQQQDNVNPRLTYRTPQLVKRGQAPGGGGGGALTSYGTQRNAIRIPERGSEPDLMMSVGLRASKPASSCFKSNLKPFASPSDALKNAMELVNSGDWESQVEGTESIARLTKHHHSVIQGDLHNINLALLKLAKNLRSQVSRAAIQAFTILFDTLKRSMESDCEKIAAMLLNRTADTNKFLQLDSHHALDALVENISPTKSIPAIINEGLNHRNAAVRTTVARLLAYEVERLGPSRALSGQKDITDRLLPAAAKLAQEGSLETRQYAKQIFQHLIRQGQFDTALKKYVSSSDVRNLQKFLDNLTSEGRTIRESARSKYASGARYTRTM